MNQHLRVPIDPLIKLLIRRRRIIDLDIVRYHEARLRLPSNDQVAQIAIVFLDVALAGPESQSLWQESHISRSPR